LDNDEAGQKGRKQIISKFGQLANIRNFYIPDEYKDIDEYITKGRISDYAEMSFLVKDWNLLRNFQSSHIDIL